MMFEGNSSTANAAHGSELEVNRDQEGLQQRHVYGENEKEARWVLNPDGVQHLVQQSPQHNRTTRKKSSITSRPWVFGFLVALVTAIVVGGIVGGAVGGALSKKSCSKSIPRSVLPSAL